MGDGGMPLLQGYGDDPPREVHAQAPVRPHAKGQIPSHLSVGLQICGLVKRVRIQARHAPRHQHHVTARQHHTVEVERLGYQASRGQHGLVADEFLAQHRNPFRRRANELLEPAIAGQVSEAEAEGRCGGVEARHHGDVAGVDDLSVGQWPPLERGVHELADHVVGPRPAIAPAMVDLVLEELEQYLLGGLDLLVGRCVRQALAYQPVLVVEELSHLGAIDAKSEKEGLSGQLHGE